MEWTPLVTPTRFSGFPVKNQYETNGRTGKICKAEMPPIKIDV